MTKVIFSVAGAATIAQNIATASQLMAQAPHHPITPEFVEATEQDIDGTERALERANEQVEDLTQALEDVKMAHEVVMQTLSAIGINVEYARDSQELKVVINPETFRGTITG